MFIVSLKKDMEQVYISRIGQITYSKENDEYNMKYDRELLMKMYDNYFDVPESDKDELFTLYSHISKDVRCSYPQIDFEQLIEQEVESEKYEHAKFYTDYIQWRKNNIPELQEKLKKIGIEVW